MKRINIALSGSTDPRFNLAAEDWLFRRMGPEDAGLLLYRNAPSVIIGRFQNPWIECHLENMRVQGVSLTRRQSGGGTVYHDLGNTNYTFFSGIDDFNKIRNSRIVVQALRGLGIPAESTERSDILVDGRKISGSAFKMKRDRAFHHGTLLIDADLENLSAILHPPERGIQSKGVASVRSPVTNLSEYVPGLNHSAVCEAVIASFCHAYELEVPETVRLDEAELRGDSGFTASLQELESWEWLFGKTPDFKQEIPFSAPFDGAVHLQVHHGCISRAEVAADERSAADRSAADRFAADRSAALRELEISQLLGSLLPGIRYNRREVAAVLEKGMTGEQGSIAAPLIDRICRFISDV